MPEMLGPNLHGNHGWGIVRKMARRAVLGGTEKESRLRGPTGYTRRVGPWRTPMPPVHAECVGCRRTEVHSSVGAERVVARDPQLSALSHDAQHPLHRSQLAPRRAVRLAFGKGCMAFARSWGATVLTSWACPEKPALDVCECPPALENPRALRHKLSSVSTPLGVEMPHRRSACASRRMSVTGST